MNCKRIQPLLSAYHDDGLGADEHALVRTHLASCPTCRRVLSGYQDLYDALRASPMAVPSDLRSHTYRRIASMQGARGQGAPFGSFPFRARRALSGTAGLVAVFGAVVLALTRLAPGVMHGHAPGAPLQVAAASTALSVTLGAMQNGRTSGLPPEERTAIAPLQSALASGAVLNITRSSASGARVTLTGDVIWTDRSGVPRQAMNLRAAVVGHARTPTVNRIDVSTPARVPTIPAGDGLVYMRLADDSPLQRHARNTWADIEWHAFTSGAHASVLVTPQSPDEQLLTGLTAGLDGHTITYAALGQQGFGGIFTLDPGTGRPRRIVDVPDWNPPNHGVSHRYVRQVYGATNGRLLYTLVDHTPLTNSTQIVMFDRGSVRPVARVGDLWYDYTVSPDGRFMAYTRHPDRRDGSGLLQVATLATYPVTRTLAVGAHPIWAPDSSKLLFESTRPAGLLVWSAQDNHVTRVAALDGIRPRFVSGLAWAPDSRFFAYVVSSLGRGGSSEVWLGDAQTGYTWRSFERAWIGSIAWASLATPPAAATVMNAPGTSTSASVARAMPTPFADTSNPASTLRSYYNAINRHEFGRALSYIAPGDPVARKSIGQFARGYQDTQAVSVLALSPAHYLNGANSRVTTCLGFELVARQAGGRVLRWGGWYRVQSTGGPNAHDQSWRIMPTYSLSRLNGSNSVPSQRACGDVAGAARHDAR